MSWRRLGRWLTPVAAVLGVFVLRWGLIVRVFDVQPYVVPSPQDSFRAMVDHWEVLAPLTRVTVQETVIGSVAECIVGMKKAPQFVPTILFGLGGIFVEVFEDVALRVAPLTSSDAAEMIRETRGFRLLARARGRPAADLAAVEDVLLKLSHLALNLEPYLVEIDINPLMLSP